MNAACSAFSRYIFTGDLAEIGALSIPARLDNISRGLEWRSDRCRPSQPAQGA